MIRLSKKGFTLIELMIVVAIIGILAAIAIPQFANMVAKSQEGATKGNLGTIRSALSIYYGDTEGYYPLGNATTSLPSLLVGQKYLKVIPTANAPRTSNNVGHPASPSVAEANLSAVTITNDAGGWVYDGRDTLATSNAWGQVIVGCTHSDAKGVLWTSY